MKENKLIPFFRLVVNYSKITWMFSLISIVSLPILTRLYNPSELGEINYFLLLSSLLSMIMIFGFDHIILRYSNSDELEKNRNLLGFLFNTLTITFIIIIIIFTLMKQWIIELYNVDVIYYYFLLLNSYLIVVQRLFNLNSRVNNNTNRFKQQLIYPSFILKLVLILSGLLYGNWQLSLLMYSILNLFITVFFLIGYRDQLNYKTLNLTNKSRMFKYAFPLMFLSPLSWLMTNYPIINIKKYLTINDVGIFTTALSIVGILNIIQSGFNTVWSPFVFKNHEKKKEMIMLINKILSLVLLSVYLFGVLFKDIIVLFVGQEYSIISSYLPYLFIIPIFQTLAETMGIGLLLKEKSKTSFFISLLMLLILFVLLYFINDHFTLLNVSLVIGIAYLMLFIIKAVVGNHYYKMFNNFTYPIYLVSVPLLYWLSIYYWGEKAIYMNISLLVIILFLLLILIKKLKRSSDLN